MPFSTDNTYSGLGKERNDDKMMVVPVASLDLRKHAKGRLPLDYLLAHFVSNVRTVV